MRYNERTEQAATERYLHEEEENENTVRANNLICNLIVSVNLM